ncbi:MAG TPA: hypothetical protein VES88_02770 [Gemmatimonadaceae bacterium]|nr:hypothetical protein [Gemmatimonadaceae bacterium]
MPKQLIALFFFGLLMALGSAAQTQTATSRGLFEQVDAIYPEIEALYLDLHQHPETFHAGTTDGGEAGRTPESPGLPGNHRRGPHRIVAIIAETAMLMDLMGR